MTAITIAKSNKLLCDVRCANPDDPVQRFAKRELLRYLRLCAGASTGRPRVESHVILACGVEPDDGFEIHTETDLIRITGTNPRGLLFGVYACLARFCHCRWPHPGEEIVPRSSDLRVMRARPWREVAAFRHRNIYPEGGRFSVKLLRRMVDWAGKNRVSDITISFSAWTKYRQMLAPEIARRGLALNLSGHCLSAFVPRAQFKKHPDWFALVGGRRMERGQYCFASPAFRHALQTAMLRFIASEPLVRRISVWANDNAFKCECPLCRRDGFLGAFSACINEIARACQRRFPGLIVDFLAYNAALDNAMLAPRGQPATSDCSTEFAYWGRDYRHAVGSAASNPADRQAERALRQWRKQNRNNLYVLEYYTDLWMHTHLMAPLPGVIAGDCRHYQKIGVDDIGTLIVLCPDNLQERFTAIDRLAPLIYQNLFFFAASAWNPALHQRALVKDYCQARFGRAGAECRQFILRLERTLAAITSFNRDLFRLRFVDIWTRDVTPRHGGVKFAPADWTPDMEWTAIDRHRAAACRRMLVGLRDFERRVGWRRGAANPQQRKNILEIRAHWRSIKMRLEGLDIQLRAQQALRTGRGAQARALLEQALRMDSGISRAERRYCRRWSKGPRAG